MTHQSFQDKVRTRKITREVFVNDNGAIDLASIMVGIIVIGLIGAIIAATIFAVIPWAQDNAAKQQLDSVKAAEDAYRGLAEDNGISEYGNNLQLAKPTFKGKEHPSLLDLDESKVLITPIPGPPPSYTATVVSQSGKTYQMGPDEKIREVKPNDGGTTPPEPSSGNLSISNGLMYSYGAEALSTKPADRANSLVGQAGSGSSNAEFQSFKTFFKSASFSNIDNVFLPDGQKYGYTDYSGQADVYMVRPNTVTISDSKKNQIAQYSGTNGSALGYIKMGDAYSWQFATAYPDEIEKKISQTTGYVVTFAFDNGTISFAGTNPNVFESGPVGTGSDVASQTFQATTVEYIPGGDNGQGYDTQEAYNNALNTRDTNFWAFRFTVSNPDPSSLPDLSDVPFVQNQDGTYTAEMQDGRWYTSPVFTFADGETKMTAGNYDMASVGMDYNDFDGSMIVTADANKKITSIKTGYIGVHLPVNSTLAEAKAKLAGSTIEYYPYGTKPHTGGVEKVSTTKTMKFQIK
jgi:type II secretory pathway pseudopilin PulG